MGAIFGSNDAADQVQKHALEQQRLAAKKQQQAALASRNRKASYSGSLIGAQSSNYGVMYNQAQSMFNLLGGSGNTNNKIG
jgi:hypothetical protein